MSHATAATVIPAKQMTRSRLCSLTAPAFQRCSSNRLNSRPSATAFAFPHHSPASGEVSSVTPSHIRYPPAALHIQTSRCPSAAHILRIDTEMLPLLWCRISHPHPSKAAARLHSSKPKLFSAVSSYNAKKRATNPHCLGYSHRLTLSVAARISTPPVLFSSSVGAFARFYSAAGRSGHFLSSLARLWYNERINR